MSLPSGYKRLEYIKSTGTQYINTGFAPNQSTRVVCDTVFAAVLAGTWLFGARHANADRTFGFLTYQNSYRSDFDTSSNETITETQSGRFTVDKDGNITKINGSTVKTAAAGTFQCSHSLFLFANNNNGTVGGYGTATVYSCQIYDNGTLIRDYIPCQTTSGDIGLWDDVNSVFYGNAGTGTFTAGPEVQKAPSTPTGFAASALTDTTVKLNWAASDGATGYKMYKNGALLATLTDTSYTDTVELFSGNTYSVTAYNDDGESEATTLTYYAAPENPILYLVTDRTAADVNAGNDKGTYKASDLNRVGAAMNYVAARLREQGYDPHISPKTDWKDDDWVDPAAQAVYLGDLAELRKQFTMLASTPEVPPRILATAINSNDGLTYTWANNIEQILVDIDALLTNIAAGWLYSGEIYSGEV